MGQRKFYKYRCDCILIAKVVKQKVYWLCGSCNVRVIQPEILLSVGLRVCKSMPRPNAISVSPLKTHVAVNIPKETIKPSRGTLGLARFINYGDSR